MKKFGESLREHAIKKINLKKIKMKLLTNKQQEWSENAEICYISKKSLNINILKIKNIVKL